MLFGVNTGKRRKKSCRNRGVTYDGSKSFIIRNGTPLQAVAAARRKVPISKMRVDKIVVNLFGDGENLQSH
jgi:hypothetical protein